MISHIQVTNAAQTKAGMTIADLVQFVQDCERMGLDPRTVVKIRTGWKQQILRIRGGGTEAP